MALTSTAYRTLIESAVATPDLDLYLSAWSSSAVLAGAEDEADAILTNIHTIVHMTVKELLKAAGLTQAAAAERFLIPKRTVENWTAGVSACPLYTKLMMAELLGIFSR